MRLVDIVEHVVRKLDYDGGNDKFLEDIRTQVNDHYVQLYVEKLWSFAQKDIYLPVYADVTTDGGVVTINDKEIFTAIDFFLPWMEGQVITIDGTECEIARIAGATSAWLVEAYPGLTSIHASIVVSQRYLDLPVDCEVLLKLVDQTRHDWLYQYTRTERDQLAFNQETVGIPTSFVATDQLAVRGPTTALVAATSTAASTLTPGTYDLRYSLKFQGRRGPLSLPVQAVVSLGDTLTATLPNLGAGSSYFKTLWGRFGDWQAYHLIQDDLNEAVTSVVLNSPVETYWLTAERAPWHDGIYQRVRLHARPSENNVLLCRYLHRPAPLAEDTDVPTFPPVHHSYLVHCVLEDLYSASDNPIGAEMSRRRAAIELAKMKARYLTPETRVWRLGNVRSMQASPIIRRTIVHLS